MQVNFDPDRFVEYVTKADDYLQLIRNKLRQAGVQGRPSSAQLPWFDLQVCGGVHCLLMTLVIHPGMALECHSPYDMRLPLPVFGRLGSATRWQPLGVFETLLNSLMLLC